MARSPIPTGVMLAALAAAAFGLATPIIAWAGRDIGPLSTAALHDPPFTGEHSHPHRHEHVEHEHEHAPDVHHVHRH